MPDCHLIHEMGAYVYKYVQHHALSKNNSHIRKIIRFLHDKERKYDDIMAVFLLALVELEKKYTYQTTFLTLFHRNSAREEY